MTDKEITEAFKKCTTQTTSESCKTCYFAKYDCVCMDELCKRVRTVIKHLQAENATLRNAIKLLREGEK